MRTFLHRSVLTRCRQGIVLAHASRGMALVPLVFALSGCGDISRLVTPGTRGPSGPALIAFTANVPRTSASATDVVALNVTSFYMRQDGTRVRIGAQVLTLTADASQSVPIPVDVGTCLADPAREISGAGGSGCVVVLSLSLVVNGAVVDEQEVGPLRLAPGATTTVAQPVTLIDVASISILQGGSVVVAASDVVPIVLGAAAKLDARVLDTRGQSVTDRPVVWSSDALTVATVDAATGVVTGVAVGTARISARVGTVSAGAQVRVQRAPAALTINVGSGGGTGTIRSTPAGIDCRVAGSSLSGTCTFSFPGESTVSLTSTPDAGSLFGAWGDACVSASVGLTCQVTMSQPRVASARFAALRRLTVGAGAAADGRGRVTGTGGLDCRIAGTLSTGVCSVDVAEGVAYQLTAVGEPLVSGGTQQFFAGWGADCANSTTSICMVTPGASNMSATARFLDVQPVVVSLAGNGGGLVTGGSTIACTRAAGSNSGVCGESATFGTQVTLTAVPDAQSQFGGWSGACSGQGTSCVTALTQSRSVLATFSRRQVTLTLVVNGPGLGSASATGAQPCALTGTQQTTNCSQSYDVGTAVTVSAAPASGSLFSGFSGACSGTGNCTVIMSGDRTVSVGFGVTQFALTVALTGTGAGSLVGSDGQTCVSTLSQTSATCTRMVNAGATVVLSAVPGVESNFDGYSGDCSGRGSCSVTMNAPRTVTASLSRKQVQLTLRLSGTGGGTVEGNGDAFCTMPLAQGPTACTKLVDYGATISFVGKPGTESLFEVFGGDCSGGTACSLTVTSPSTITASFRRRQVPVTLALVGTGAGSVSIDGSVACSLVAGQMASTCTRMTDVGTTISVSGAAIIASSFDAFSGDCTGVGRCTLVISAERTVNAMFTLRQVPLTVQLSGAGGGSVLLNGAPSCALAVAQGSSTCSRLVNIGTPIVLTAAETVESVFDGFGGACTSTTCTITPAAPIVVQGAFSIKQLPIALELRGTGGGSLSVNGTVACAMAVGQNSVDCLRTVSYGSVVTIAPAPTNDSSLDGMSGDCSGIAACTLTVQAPLRIRAGYTLRQVPINIALASVRLGHSGTVTINSTAVCTLSTTQLSVACTRMVPLGTTVQITVVLGAATGLEGFGGDCAPAGVRSGLTCTLGVSGPHDVSVLLNASSPLPPPSAPAAVSVKRGAGVQR